MIAYLERLAAALLARDPEEIRRLLAEAEGRSLPADVRREAEAIRREGAAGHRTPLRALHHLHRTRQLYDGLPRSAGVVASPPSAAERPSRARPAPRPGRSAPTDGPGIAASPDR